MTNALATLQKMKTGLATPQDDAAFDEMAQSTGFLGRVQLFGSNSKAAKKRLIQGGNWGIPVNDTTVIDLGEKIDIIPLARRAKAVDMSDLQNIVVNYDHSSDTFADIKARSSTQDSGCQYGVSFLVIERQSGRLLELFFGSKSSRPVAKNLYAHLPIDEATAKAKGIEAKGPTPCALKSTLIEKPKFSWHAPEYDKSITPFKDLPPVDLIEKEVVKFLNADSDEVETTDEAEADVRD